LKEGTKETIEEIKEITKETLDETSRKAKKLKNRTIHRIKEVPPMFWILSLALGFVVWGARKSRMMSVNK